MSGVEEAVEVFNPTNGDRMSPPGQIVEITGFCFEPSIKEAEEDKAH